MSAHTDNLNQTHRSEYEDDIWWHHNQRNLRLERMVIICLHESWDFGCFKSQRGHFDVSEYDMLRTETVIQAKLFRKSSIFLIDYQHRYTKSDRKEVEK